MLIENSFEAFREELARLTAGFHKDRDSYKSFGAALRRAAA
jgi:hypothetical protein